MVRGDVSKLLFLDSSVSTHGDKTKVMLPPHPFSAQSNERMALTLQSFSMRRNWYNLNDTNRIFYLFVNGVYYEVAITAGVSRPKVMYACCFLTLSSFCASMIEPPTHDLRGDQATRDRLIEAGMSLNFNGSRILSCFTLTFSALFVFMQAFLGGVCLLLAPSGSHCSAPTIKMDQILAIVPWLFLVTWDSS